MHSLSAKRYCLVLDYVANVCCDNVSFAFHKTIWPPKLFAQNTLHACTILKWTTKLSSVFLNPHERKNFRPAVSVERLHFQAQQTNYFLDKERMLHMYLFIFI